VKEALQRARDVLLSGPFKKFQKKIPALCITAFCATSPENEPSGASSAAHEHSDFSLGEKRNGFAPEGKFIA